MKEFKAMLGSFLRVFLSSILTLIIAQGGVTNLEWLHIFEASLISALPVLYNYLNPKDTRYGNGAKSE
jgi:hypothetical protein